MQIPFVVLCMRQVCLYICLRNIVAHTTDIQRRYYGHLLPVWQWELYTSVHGFVFCTSLLRDGSCWSLDQALGACHELIVRSIQLDVLEPCLNGSVDTSVISSSVNHFIHTACGKFNTEGTCAKLHLAISTWHGKLRRCPGPAGLRRSCAPCPQLFSHPPGYARRSL